MSENKFTPRAEEALRLSQEAAEEMGHGYVGSEHLLLGLIREEEGIAHRVLAEYGLPVPRAWWSWLCPSPPAWAAATSARSTC